MEEEIHGYITSRFLSRQLRKVCSITESGRPDETDFAEIPSSRLWQLEHHHQSKTRGNLMIPTQLSSLQRSVASFVSEIAVPDYYAFRCVLSLIHIH